MNTLAIRNSSAAVNSDSDASSGDSDASSSESESSSGDTESSSGDSESPNDDSESSSTESVDTANRHNEMVFFDLETTTDFKNKYREVIEFGAIVVDRFTYRQLYRYNFLIRPLSGTVDAGSYSIHKISYSKLKSCHPFSTYAKKIYSILHGRVWVGHNINRFDIPVLQKEFGLVKHAFPSFTDSIDTLKLFMRIFPKDRAGNYKMATLGRYFGHGEEQHRAIEDCEMTIEVLKSISLTHLLETALPRLNIR